MEIILIIVLGVTGILIITGLINHSRAKSYLNKELAVEPKILKKVKDKTGIEATAAVGITIFDVLYNTAKMDPFVLKGIDHLHQGQNFESLGNLSDYLKANIIKSEEGTTAWRQMIHKYKGYTGEEYTFDKLDQKGVDYIRPKSGTNEQYDAMMDGKKVDIAITDDPRYIAEKLEDPEIFVYTNREMVATYSNNPRVLIDTDLSVQEIFEKTNGTFSGVVDLGDFVDGIPLITALISGIKNTKGIIDKKKDISTALEHTIIEVATVGIGGWIGGGFGIFLGAALAPTTGGVSLIIIPLVIVVLAVKLSRKVGKKFKERHLRKAQENLRNTAREFKTTFLKQYYLIISRIEKTYKQNIYKSKYAEKESQNWFGRTFFPKIITKFYSLASKKFTDELGKTQAFYKNLKIKLEASSEYDGGILLYSQGSSILGGDSKLLSIYNEMSNKIQSVENEIKKLS